MHSKNQVLCMSCLGGSAEYTKSMLHRWHLNIEDSATCVMCTSGEEETIQHLFFDCPFAKECWAILHFQWDDSLLPPLDRLVQAGNAHN